MWNFGENRMNIRLDELVNVKINNLDMKCYSYLFSSLDAILIYTHFLKRKWVFMCNLLFVGDGKIYVEKDSIGEFDGILEDLGIQYYTESQWDKVRSIHVK